MASGSSGGLFPEPKPRGPSVGDARKLARRDDPPESKAAAAEIAPYVESVKQDALDLVDRYPDRTVSELATLFDARDPRQIGRRLPELEADGLVVRFRGDPCSITRRAAARWRLTDERGK